MLENKNNSTKFDKFGFCPEIFNQNMKQSFLSRYFPSVIALVGIGILFYSCDRSGSPIPAPIATCINTHVSIYDSVCKMDGTRPSNEHHIKYEWDSGKLVKNISTNATNVNFTVSVAADKIVTYLNYKYTLIDSNSTVMHFANYNIASGNHADIFYYPQKDSFVVATSITVTLPQVIQTDLDTLFTYW